VDALRVREACFESAPEFQAGSLVVVAADLRPQDNQTVAARLATEATVVFGVYSRDGDCVTIQAHGRKYRTNLATDPGGILWAYPVRLVQRRYLT